MNGTPNQEQFILDRTKVFETVRREGKGGGGSIYVASGFRCIVGIGRPYEHVPEVF